jgi:hypothetical protein
MGGPFLKLTGGTLTGALNGTSASFTGNAALGTATLLSGGGAASWLTLNGTPYSGGIVYAVSSVAKGYSYYDNALNVIAVQGNTGVGAALIVNGTTNALTIAATGAATFSSSVTAVEGTFSGLIRSTVGNNTNVLVSTAATTGYQAIQLANTGGNGVWVLGSSTGTNVFSNGAAYSTQIGTLGSTALQFGTESLIRMTIASTGAATFSSTITAATLSTIGTAVAAQNVQLNLNGVSGKAQRIEFQNSGVQQWLLGAGAASETSAFEIFNSTGIISLSINKSTNAATFSSSVTIEGNGSTIRSGNELRFNRTDNAIYTRMYDAGSGAANGFIFDNTNGEGFHFKNTTTTLMRMNSSGNVGIGITSPAFQLDVSPGVASATLRVGSWAIVENVTTNQAMFGRNVVYQTSIGTGWRNINTGGATAIRMYDDPGDPSIAFHLHPSETAGTSLTSWDTADVKMTIRNSGNVLIGTTTDNGNKLRVNGVGFFDSGVRTGQPFGTTTNNWLLGRALVSGTSTPDRWIRVQIGLEYYDILAVHMGTVPT